MKEETAGFIIYMVVITLFLSGIFSLLFGDPTTAIAAFIGSYVLRTN